MTTAKFAIPEIAEHERTPLVLQLLDIIDQLLQVVAEQTAQLQEARDENRKLKDLPARPKIKPSKLESPAPTGTTPKTRKPRSRSRPRPPRQGAEVQHRTVDIPVPPEQVPAGATFKGYLTYTVQEIHIFVEVVTYRRERYCDPDGKSIVAPLPDSQRAVGGHFGPNLIAYIIAQYYDHRVTQPRLLDQLHDMGVEISDAQLSLLLTTKKDQFHQEKQEILDAALQASCYVHADDTGDRHKGRNGFMTVVGNDWFSYFRASGTKSRLNFLMTLRGDHEDYFLHELSFEYMRLQDIGPQALDKLETAGERAFADEPAWLDHLARLGIAGEETRKTASEAALLGSVLNHGANPNLGILSDGAGQFDLVVLLHALCWIHALRPLERLAVSDEAYQKELDRVFQQVWDLYRELKAYRAKPDQAKKEQLSQEFDRVFGQETAYSSITTVLRNILQKKAELLQVLNRPELPLHNNGAELDVREQAQRRKVSGTTRSDEGQRCRDTFMSLVKTCMKLGVSFNAYLKDRLTGEGKIPRLAQLLRQKAAEQQAAQAKAAAPPVPAGENQEATARIPDG